MLTHAIERVGPQKVYDDTFAISFRKMGNIFDKRVTISVNYKEK